MIMFKSKFISCLVLLIPFVGFSQSPKKYFAAAEKFKKANNIQDAVDNYSKAIELDPEYEKAYIARAICYEKLNKKNEAVQDYKKAILFSPKEKEYYYNAGRLLVDLEKYADADQQLRKALERDNSYEEAINAEIKVIHKTKDFKYGVTVTKMALDIKETVMSHFNHAVMYDSLGSYVEAEKEYKSAKFYDSKYV